MTKSVQEIFRRKKGRKEGRKGRRKKGKKKKKKKGRKEGRKEGKKEGRKECMEKEKKVEGGNWEKGIREKRQNTLNDIDLKCFDTETPYSKIFLSFVPRFTHRFE